MGFFKSIGKALGVSTGLSSNDPKLEKYDMDTAVKSGNIGVISDYGNVGLKKNADGTWSRTFESSENDKQRNAMMADILSGMGDKSGADAWYDAAASRVNEEFDKQRATADENLINRGISVGSKQYNDTMADILDQQNQNLTDLSSQAVFKGQELDAGKIDMANQLAAGRDIGIVSDLGLQNNNYADYLSQSNNAKMAKSAATAQQGNNLLKTGAAVMGLF